MTAQMMYFSLMAIHVNVLTYQSGPNSLIVAIIYRLSSFIVSSGLDSLIVAIVYRLSSSIVSSGPNSLIVAIVYRLSSFIVSKCLLIAVARVLPYDVTHEEANELLRHCSLQVRLLLRCLGIHRSN